MSEETKAAHIQELIKNRKASFHYEILETFEVGIVLLGTEIKSLRLGGASLDEAYVTEEEGELWLLGASIAPYSFGSFYNHEEKRKRKLLAHKREIAKIDAALNQKGLTCVPLSLYLKNGRAKLRIGIARGKKTFDKRQTIQKREEKRTIDRMMKKAL
jgi:SsrA-binding protein